MVAASARNQRRRALLSPQNNPAPALEDCLEKTNPKISPKPAPSRVPLNREE
jgi:hypothetical protein